MQWFSITEDEAIPSWLKEHLPTTCKYCGQPMLAGHNEYGRITGLRCADMDCPSMIASRLVFIYEILEIKGTGFARAYELVKLKKWKHPIEYLQLLDKKPTMSIGTFLRCNCIQGIDGEWATMADKADCYTLDEMFAAYPTNEYLLENKEMLYRNLQYVNLTQRRHKKAKGVVPITIMITGTPIGFNNKAHFIAYCNEYCKGEYRIIHQETKKQSGVHFLIREPGSVTRGKLETALKANIPVITSEEFLTVLSILMKEVEGNEDS